MQSNPAKSDRLKTDIEECLKKFIGQPGSEESLSFLNKMLHEFRDQPHISKAFLYVMKKFKYERLHLIDVIRRLAALFRGHPELMMAFNDLLPIGYSLEVKPNDEVQVFIEATDLVGVTSYTISPCGPPDFLSRYLPLTNQKEQDSPHATPVSEENLKLLHGPFFEESLSFLDQVQYEFRHQPHIYKAFLDVMKKFKLESLHVIDVIRSVSVLFRGHSELMMAFNDLLPIGYSLELKPNDEVHVFIGDPVFEKLNSFTGRPSGPPNVPAPSVSGTNQKEQASPHATPVSKSDIKKNENEEVESDVSSKKNEDVSDESDKEK